MQCIHFNASCSKLLLFEGFSHILSNLPFLIFDIRVLWCSVLSARMPKCQKLKLWVRPVWQSGIDGERVKCLLISSNGINAAFWRKAVTVLLYSMTQCANGAIIVTLAMLWHLTNCIMIFYRASICEGGLGSRNSVCPSVRLSVCPSVCLSVCHTRGLWQN